MLGTKIRRVPCRRRDEGSFPRAEKFGDLITDYTVLNEGSESRNNHRHAVVVKDLATQWIQPYPCKHKKFAGDGEESTKVSRAVTEAKNYLCRQFIGIWQMLWRIITESSNVHTLSLRNKRNCRTSFTTSKRGNISRIIAIWIGWKVVVRFCGMPLLSSKCTGSAGRRENSAWTKICWGIF